MYFGQLILTSSGISENLCSHMGTVKISIYCYFIADILTYYGNSEN